MCNYTKLHEKAAMKHEEQSAKTTGEALDGVCFNPRCHEQIFLPSAKQSFCSFRRFLAAPLLLDCVQFRFVKQHHRRLTSTTHWLLSFLCHSTKLAEDLCCLRATVLWDDFSNLHPLQFLKSITKYFKSKLQSSSCTSHNQFHFVDLWPSLL